MCGRSADSVMFACAGISRGQGTLIVSTMEQHENEILRNLGEGRSVPWWLVNLLGVRTNHTPQTIRFKIKCAIVIQEFKAAQHPSSELRSFTTGVMHMSSYSRQRALTALRRAVHDRLVENLRIHQICQ